MDINQKRQEAMLLMKRQQAMALMSAQKPSEADIVNDEMPAWLSDSRSVVKNLSNNDGEAIRYLQQQHPDAEFKQNGDDIIARKRGEATYGKLDPSFSPLSNPIGTLKDTWNDTKDLGYDAAQGIAEGAGAAVGAAGNLPGIMAGAAAGAGVASTAKELLRKHYGLSDEVSGSAIAKDAAIGAALPGVFAGIKKAAPAIPWAYSKAIGLSPDGMQMLAKRGEDIARVGKEGVTSTLESMSNRIKNALGSETAALGTEFNALTGNKVPLSGAKQKFLDAIKQEESRGFNNALSEERRGALNQAQDAIFKAPKKMPVILDADGQNIYKNLPAEMIPEEVSVRDALDLQQMINSEYGDYGRNAINMGQHRLGAGNGSNAIVERTAMDASSSLNEALEGATDGASQGLKDRYRRHILNTKQVAPKFKDGATAEGTIKKLQSERSDVLNELIARLDLEKGTGIKDTSNLIEAYKFLNPSKQEGFRGGIDAALGASPIEKALSVAGGGLGATVGGFRGGIVGVAAGRGVGKAIASPRTVKQFLKAQNATEKGMKALENNPLLFNTIYGGAYSGNE